MDHWGVNAVADPTELSDRWLLNMRGSRITRICVDLQLTLTFGSGWTVALESPFTLSVGPLGGRRELSLTPGTQDVAAVLQLFGCDARSAVAFKSGSLRMVFDTGAHLLSRADPLFEAWQVTGPRGRSFVSMAGGGLTVLAGRSGDTNG